MIISISLKNFFSIRDEAVIDFTAEGTARKADDTDSNVITLKGDRFVNVIGMFGGNASGKSNIIKAVDFCRRLVLTSHLNNEGDKFDYEPFKFGNCTPSEFSIRFITDGVEYEYSFELFEDKIISESLYHYPKNRKSRVFVREKTNFYTYGKGTIVRPTEVEVNTGPRTLFLSRASSMNRQIAQQVFRFFLNQMAVDAGTYELNDFTSKEFDEYRDVLLKAFEVSDSDIINIQLQEYNGQKRLISYHREDPSIPFDFTKEESEGTKRLLMLLMLFIRKAANGATIFLDEFDLKLHLRLAEFILDFIRASKGGQLVFTSHNPALININKLRKEQIIFVNKQLDGNSEFVPLSDYQGLTKTMDVQKAYLQGRFDAVPYIGDIFPVLSDLIELNEKKRT